MHTFKEITDILEEIYKLNEINDIIYINGGIVPYLINNKAKTRNHSDIDILVNLKDMDTIRNVLKKYNLYSENKDSLKLANQDFGIHTNIRCIDIGFYPFVIEDNGIKINTFSIDDKTTFKSRFIAGLTFNDFYEIISFKNYKIKIIKRELLYILKENLTRNIDKLDYVVLKKLNMNKECITRLRKLNISKYTNIDDFITEKESKN